MSGSRLAKSGAPATSLDTGERVDVGFSQAVHFHETQSGDLVIYNAHVMAEKFDAGDHAGVADVYESDDGVREGIVAYDATSADPGLGSASDSSSTASQTNGSPEIANPSDPQMLLYPHYLCVQLKVDFTDAGFQNSVGITEDHWADNDPMEVTAHGIKTKINGSLATADSSGCATFYHSQQFHYATVDVHSRSTLASGAYIRLHDGPSDTTADLPGFEYVRTVTNVPFQTGLATVVQVGLYNERWTAMAAFAKSLNRYSDNLPSNTEIHVNDQSGCDPDPQCNPSTEYCCDCSINTNYFNDIVDNESYIRMQSKDCWGTNLRTKFLCSHEYGHAYGFQVASKSGMVPSSASHPVTPSDCPFDNPGYNNDTKEWTSLALREGFAHWVSARVWNDNAADGQFQWGQSFDLERWNAGDTPRGYLKNVCCVTGSTGTAQQCADSLNGTATIPDWMRALWDLHTDSCDDAPSRAGVTQLFANVINYPGTLQNGLFFAYTTLEVPTLFPDCGDAWDDIGCHNGLDELGSIQSGSCN